MNRAARHVPVADLVAEVRRAGRGTAAGQGSRRAARGDASRRPGRRARPLARERAPLRLPLAACGGRREGSLDQTVENHLAADHRA